MMTIEDTTALLARISLIDGREVSDGMILAWSEVFATRPRVTLEQAIAQLNKHAAKTSAWVTPADCLPYVDPNAWMEQDSRVAL